MQTGTCKGIKSFGLLSKAEPWSDDLFQEKEVARLLRHFRVPIANKSNSRNYAYVQLAWNFESSTWLWLAGAGWNLLELTGWG